jgi:hypothetical protein
MQRVHVASMSYAAYAKGVTSAVEQTEVTSEKMPVTVWCGSNTVAWHG